MESRVADDAMKYTTLAVPGVAGESGMMGV